MSDDNSSQIEKVAAQIKQITHFSWQPGPVCLARVIRDETGFVGRDSDYRKH